MSKNPPVIHGIFVNVPALRCISSTIGFGDFYPVTLGGRIIVALIFYIGVGMVGFVGAQFVKKFVGFDFEKKFKVKIVRLGLEKDYETDKPSWNLNIVTAVGRTADEVLKSLKERGVIKTEE